ncbi:MAG: hypothetical protein IPL79_01180 [Myxococcales bacterium]|nr:hypothetical protein [Myxococcales bacterium]
MQPQDDTRQDPSAFDALAAQFESCLGNPGDAELFDELKAKLRERGDAVRLAAICQRRAEHVGGDVGAALLVEAASASRIAGQLERAEEQLRAAVALVPSHRGAANSLVELLLAQGRIGHAATCLEMTLVALAEQALAGERIDAPYQSSRHGMLARLYLESLGRLDRGLVHLREAWRLDVENADATQLARAWYPQLGEHRALIEFIEAALAALHEKEQASARIALLVELAHTYDLAGEPVRAVTHFEQALALGGGIDVREPLAHLYASARFAAASGQTLELTNKRASDLFVDLGKRAHVAGQLDRALRLFRKALGLLPFDGLTAQLLADALAAKGELDELDRFLAQRVEMAERPADRAALIARRITVADMDPNKRAPSSSC